MIGSRPYTPAQTFHYVNPHIHAHAKGQPCTNCGADDQTVVFAHSNQACHGHGRGIKSHSLFGAFLCHACHYFLDQGSAGLDPSGRWLANRSDKTEMFNQAMFRTQIILLRDGVLK